MTEQQTSEAGARTQPRTNGAWLVPLLVAAACVVLVAGLVDGVRERGDLSTLDPGVTRSFVGVRTSALTRVAHVVTTLGSVPVLVALAVVVASLLCWRRRSPLPLATMGLALGGSALLTYGLKAFVGRQRPPVGDMLGGVDRDFAFPSGHTLNSAVFVAVLCWLTRHQLARLDPRARAGVLVVAGLVAFLVGVSRVYLGYHWMTDVLAGWLVALGWLSLLLAGRQWFSSRRAA